MKKNENDIKESYRDNYFKIFSNSSQYNVLKHDIINFLIFVQKKELICEMSDRVQNNVNNNSLVVIETRSHLFSIIDIII